MQYLKFGLIIFGTILAFLVAGLTLAWFFTQRSQNYFAGLFTELQDIKYYRLPLTAGIVASIFKWRYDSKQESKQKEKAE